MRITDSWHLILGRDGEQPLAGPRDCCVYGVVTAEALLVFDAGAGEDEGQTVAAFARAGLPQLPMHVFITHGHADHSGGAHLLQSRFGATVYAGGLTADWLGRADEEAVSLAAARDARLYPAEYQLKRCPVDHVVADGDEVEVGGVSVRVLATPGHSADHLSFLVTLGPVTALVAGDAIFADGRVILQDSWDCSVSETCRTIRKLAAVPFDLLLPGHGAPLLEHGRGAVDIAMQRVERFLPPLNLL